MDKMRLKEGPQSNEKFTVPEAVAEVMGRMPKEKMDTLPGDDWQDVAAKYLAAHPRSADTIVVGEQGHEFFKNLTGYAVAKKEIDATAIKVLPKNYMTRYSSFKDEAKMLQTPHDVTDHDVSLDTVYETAAKCQPTFDRIIACIARAAGLDPDESVHFPSHDMPRGTYRRVTKAPFKGRVRATEKVENEYGGDASRLVDVVRCSVIVDTEKQLIQIANVLERGDGEKAVKSGSLITTLEGDLFEIVRLKNRFEEPLFNGYRDALYSIRVRYGDVDQWHVCEMQLHLSAVIAHKKRTHIYYEYFRTYFGGNLDAADANLMKLLKVNESGASSLEELVSDCADGADLERMHLVQGMLAKNAEYGLALILARSRLRLEVAKKSEEKAILDAMFAIGELEWRMKRGAVAFSMILAVYRARAADLDEDHPRQLEVVHRLASVLKRLDRYHDAAALYRVVLEARRKKLGVDHYQTLETANNLSFLLYKLDCKSEAEAIYRSTLELKIAKFGPDSPNLHNTANGLAVLLNSMHRLDEAEPLYRTAFDGRTKKLGADHPYTLQTAMNFAVLLKKKGQYDQCVDLYRYTLDHRTKKLGHDDAETLLTGNNLAMLLKRTGQYEEARDLLSSILKIKIKKYGPNHNSTRETRAKLLCITDEEESGHQVPTSMK